jgi:phage-related protein
MLFFNIGMDNNIKELELVIYQDLLNNTGVYKNIHFHNRISSKNTTINVSNIREDFLKNIGDLEYYSLEENFKTLEKELEELEEEEDYKIFGSIYFKLNTKQNYIIQVFKKQLNKLGIGIIEIEPKYFLNKDTYNILSPHSLFKFNMVLDK